MDPGFRKNRQDTPSFKTGDTVLSHYTPFENMRAHRLQSKAAQVKLKLANGVYKLEDLPCFCGAEGGKEVVTKERYGIPHRIVICEECALMRANPRMTPEAYNSFYNKEYRYINHNESEREAPLRDEHDETALYWVREVASGEEVLKVYEDQGQVTFPKTLIDFGCHYGGMMKPWQDRGVECYGVELDEASVKIAQDLGFDISRSLDELIERGIKADFILMQDIIEHLTDLRGDMDKVGQLLNEGGVIYVWTPGLFGPTAQTIKNLFQLAHTYQFCGTTLDYVMDVLGYTPLFLDEVISSFWRRKVGQEVTFPPRKPKEWVEYSIDQLAANTKRKLPLFKSICKFTRKERYEYIEENCQKGLPDIEAITEKYSGDMIVIGGGPSVNQQLPKIKELKARGIPVMCISRMYPWCVKNGLGPDFVASMDSTDEQELGFTDINPKAIHLMCSVTRPSLVDKLPKGTAYIWDNMDEIRVREIRQKHGYKVATVVQGGGSITFSCLSLGMNLGFGGFHVFGADCMFSDKDQTHAAGIAGENVQQVVEEVTIKGVVYLSTAAFVMFAKHFLDMVWAGYQAGLLKHVKFYGNSLINRMWDGKFLTEEEMKYIGIPEDAENTKLTPEQEVLLKQLTTEQEDNVRENI